MSDTFLLHCVVEQLYQILPLETLELLEKIVSSKKWGTGDVCFGCENECERHLKFLDLPKKVKLCTIDFFSKSSKDLPLCKICAIGSERLNDIGYIFWDMHGFLCNLQGKFYYTPNPIPCIEPGIPWDPVSYYAIIEAQQELEIPESRYPSITQMLLDSADFNSMYPSLIGRIQRKNFFKRDVVGSYSPPSWGDMIIAEVDYSDGEY